MTDIHHAAASYNAGWMAGPSVSTVLCAISQVEAHPAATLSQTICVDVAALRGNLRSGVLVCGGGLV